MPDRYTQHDRARAIDIHPFGAALMAHDVDAAVGLLAANVAFRSPVVFAPYRGPDAVAPVLHAITEVLQDYRYTRAMVGTDARDHAMVFEARVGDRQIEGCDFLHLDDVGTIDELVVMVRPMSGVHAIAVAMKEQLEAAAAQPTKA